MRRVSQKWLNFINLHIFIDFLLFNIELSQQFPRAMACQHDCYFHLASYQFQYFIEWEMIFASSSLGQSRLV